MGSASAPPLLAVAPSLSPPSIKWGQLNRHRTQRKSGAPLSWHTADAPSPLVVTTLPLGRGCGHNAPHVLVPQEGPLLSVPSPWSLEGPQGATPEDEVRGSSTCSVPC